MALRQHDLRPWIWLLRSRIDLTAGLGTVALLISLIMTQPALASGVTATGPDSFTLADGRIVRLAAIRAPDQAHWATAAQERLSQFVTADAELMEQGKDRYGRILGDFRVAGQTLTAQAMLLRDGLATLYPVVAAPTYLAELQQQERSAHAARRGLWAEADTICEAAHAAAAIGGYALITGQVVTATRIKNKVYVNFGSDWRHDFTVEITAGDLRRLKKSGLDPLTLIGQTILVRGWVEQRNGPMIAVTEAWQIMSITSQNRQ